MLLHPAQSVAQTGGRVALVIGNDNYQSLPQLNNAVRDARSMADRLTALGFEVILSEDADRRGMGIALARFEQAATSAEVALAFFAGHGIQSEGANWLIPADARLEGELALRYEGFDSSEFLAAMQRAGSAINILILDACRDNPLPQRSRSAARGLNVSAIPSGLGGTAILYSAGPGQRAEDGPPGGNGIFTGQLLTALESPNLKIEDVFKQTAGEVYKITEGRQQPWMHFSLQGDFVFNPQKPELALQDPKPEAGSSSAPAPTTRYDQNALEIAFWNSIQASQDPTLFLSYLDQFPDGTFASLAESKVALLAPNRAPAWLAERRDGTLKPGDTFRDCPECPLMTVVPAGETMFRGAGDAPSLDTSSDQDSTLFRVSSANPYAIGVFEVTRAEFQAFLDAAGARHQVASRQTRCTRMDGMGFITLSDRRPRSFASPLSSSDPKHPATCIGLDDAQAYADWISRRTGLNYRVPMESEWIWAATGGKVAEASPRSANCVGCAGGSKDGTSPVGSYLPNAFGIHDMAGNVHEWVDCAVRKQADRFENHSCENLVLRGGSHVESSRFQGLAARMTSGSAGDLKLAKYDTHGFRVVRSIGRERQVTTSVELDTSEELTSGFAAFRKSQTLSGDLLGSWAGAGRLPAGKRVALKYSGSGFGWSIEVIDPETGKAMGYLNASFHDFEELADDIRPNIPESMRLTEMERSVISVAMSKLSQAYAQRLGDEVVADIADDTARNTARNCVSERIGRFTSGETGISNYANAVDVAAAPTQKARRIWAAFPYEFVYRELFRMAYKSVRVCLS